MKKGFTIIELLVVIAIMSLLSSIIFGSLQEARAKSRNSQRVQSLVQLRNAIELYRLNNGRYPVPSDNPPPNLNNHGASCWNCIGDIYSIPNASLFDPEHLSEIAPYMPSRPEDPRLNPDAVISLKGYWYQVDPAGNDYKLLLAGTVEGGSGSIATGNYSYPAGIPVPMRDPNFWPTAADLASLSVYSAGARCWDWQNTTPPMGPAC